MLPGALLTGILVWRAFANNRAVTERRLLESARVDASAIDREFTGTISILEALATSPALDRDDLAAFHQEGVRVQATQSGWYTIVLLSPEGQQLVSTRLPWGTPLLPAHEPASLRELVTTLKPAVGHIRLPQRGGSEHLFAIRVPVMREGRLKYALSAVVDVNTLEQVVPPQLPGSEEWTRSILDPEGTIAVRTRGAENFVGTRATEAFRVRLNEAFESISSLKTREGLPVYAAHSRGTFGWTAVVVVPREALARMFTEMHGGTIRV